MNAAHAFGIVHSALHIRVSPGVSSGLKAFRLGAWKPYYLCSDRSRDGRLA